MVYWYWYKMLSWWYENFTKNNSVDIYQYSIAQLKYLPKKSVKTLLKPMLYSNKPVYLDKDVDRRRNNSDDDNKWKIIFFKNMYTEFP